jgi:FkbM family methyltransferase
MMLQPRLLHPAVYLWEAGAIMVIKEKIHIFDNGVKVYDYHLLPAQRERYKKRNVHEADEEDIFIEIINSIPTYGCFVNIGSAIGYYPILAKKLSSNLTIHAFEPLKAHKKHFFENIMLNDLRLEDFCFYQKGISFSGGLTSFLEQGFGSKIVNIIEKKTLKSRIKLAIKILLTQIGIKHYKLSKITKINTITLDKLMDEIGKSADLLQMDVQGLEVDILNGGLRSLHNGNVKTFLVGTHGKKRHQECLNILKEYRYAIEFENGETTNQPDGIIVASKNAKRLKA